MTRRQTNKASLPEDALAELSELIETSVQITASEAESVFGDRLRWLVDSGVLADGGDAALVCEACDEPHPVDLDFDDVRRRWGYRCDLGGWRDVNGAARRLLQINNEAFAGELARCLNATPRDFRTISNNIAYKLGSVSLPRPWTAVFARDLVNEHCFDDVMKALRRGAGKAPGLLVTTSNIPRSVQLPAGFRLAKFNEVVELTPQGLKADETAIARLLAGKPPALSRGPKSLAGAAQVWVRSYRRRRPRAAAAEIVLALKKKFKRSYPHRQLPGDKRIRYEWLKGELP